MLKCFTDLLDNIIVSWKESASVWLEACYEDDLVNRILFSHVLETFVISLNKALVIVQRLWNCKSLREKPIPIPPFGFSRDEE
jgi:hypothetical protein